MKKFLLLFLFQSAIIFAQNNAANFKGKFVNNDADSLFIENVKRRTVYAIPIDKNGNFSALVQPGSNLFYLKYGQHKINIFLANDYDLTITANAKEFTETLTYEGKGANENNFLAQMARDEDSAIADLPEDASEDDFKNLVSVLTSRWSTKLKEGSYVTFFKIMMNTISSIEEKTLYSRIIKKYTKVKREGKPSPGFAYKDIKGNIVKLSDFKGRYVYIDIWATWCGPCRQQIPYLKELEVKFKDKNIAFVSTSIDKADDFEKWKEVVGKEELGGTQLVADKDWKSEFIGAYRINSIPRFILIDPKGNVVNADADRPGNPTITEQLETLLR